MDRVTLRSRNHAASTSMAMMKISKNVVMAAPIFIIKMICSRMTVIMAISCKMVQASIAAAGSRKVTVREAVFSGGTSRSSAILAGPRRSINSVEAVMGTTAQNPTIKKKLKYEYRQSHPKAQHTAAAASHSRV